MKIPLPLLVVFFSALVNSLPVERALDVTLYRDQYIGAYVGSEGREVIFRVRFDSDEIVLYSPLTGGASYDSIASTELFSVGAGNVFRWRARYTFQGDTTVRDPSESDDRTSHQGVFGLGAGSPVWSTFDAWTRSPTHLSLGWIAPHSVPLIPGSLDIASDYTLASWDMMGEWANSSSTATSVPVADGISVRVMLVGERYRTVRLWTDGELGAVKVGFPSAKSLVVSRVVSSDEWTVAIASVPVPVTKGEYLWLFVGLFTLCWVFYPSLSELLHRVYWTYPARPETSGKGLRDNDWSLISSISLWIALLALLAIHGSLVSYRSMQDMAEPYGDSNAALAYVVYYTLMVAIVASVALADPRHISDASVVHRSSSLYFLCWLALVTQFDEGINMVLMILLSAIAFLRQSDLFLRTIYVLGWNAWPTWAWLLTTLASGWFFAFYTVAEYIEERWPGHPSSFFLEAFALVITWTFGALEPFAHEHIVHFREIVRKMSGDSRLAASQPLSVMESRHAAIPIAIAVDPMSGTMDPSFGAQF